MSRETELGLVTPVAYTVMAPCNLGSSRRSGLELKRGTSTCSRFHTHVPALVLSAWIWDEI